MNTLETKQNSGLFSILLRKNTPWTKIWRQEKGVVPKNVDAKKSLTKFSDFWSSLLRRQMTGGHGEQKSEEVAVLRAQPVTKERLEGKQSQTAVFL